MKKMGNKFKMNNRGSSLVFVLIAVAFVSILTAVIVSAATTNYRLRVMNDYSKKTFYSAESALDEVYAGLGKVTCTTLEDNYLKIAQNLTQRVEVGGNTFVVKIDNDEANKKLKESFYTDLKNIIYTEDSLGTLCEYLSKFLTNPEKAYVADYGTITYDEESCKIIVEDVVVAYKEKDLDYFSTVAVDMELKYPDNEFDFISNTKSTLETFLDYGIIAMDGLYIGKDSSVSNGRIVGGVFAGGPGINVGYNSKLKVGNGGLDLHSKIITSGNMVTMGTLDFEEGELWCVNLNASDSTSGGAVLDFGENTAIYVADDLNVEGNNCEVTLGSKFYGFGYNGTVSGGYSSAIVVNGRATIIKATKLSQFVIAGRAYLDFQDVGAHNYMTADSLSLRGIQEIYLVPVYYLQKRGGGYGDTVTNPSSDITLMVNFDDFFAKELLDPSNPYLVRNVKGIYYYYLNFKDVESQKKYVNCVLDKNYLVNNIANKGTRYETDWKELNKIVDDNMEKFILDGEVHLGFKADAKVYTAGNLYQVEDDMSSKLITMSPMDVLGTCLDKQNRYAIMLSFLYDIGNDDNGTAYSSLPSDIVISGNTYSTGDISTVGAYDRIVDTGLLELQTKNYYKRRADGTIAAVFVKDDPTAFDAGVTVPHEVTGIADGVITIPADVVGGVVLAYDLDVIVQSNFEGLIITNGKVYTKTGNNDIVTNGIRDVASRILDEDMKLAKFFYAYQMETDNTRDISIIDVADLLSFNNWRKNYAK